MTHTTNHRKILLIGWDAADWKFINPLLDAGRMPHLSRLVDQGVIANLASLRPCLSPILWTSIATGKMADKHGITGFVEPLPGGGGLRLSTSTSRKTKALWNILSQNGLKNIVINWFASHPAEPIQGTCISNRFFEGLPEDPRQEWKITDESVHPATLGPVISGFRLHPAELAPADLARFIPQIDNIDLRRDSRPGLLAETLAKTVSIHSVATGALEAEPWDFLAVYYDGLDVGGHHFMPYHPPRIPTVPENDFELYQHVMTELYLFHDELLGRLLQLAGEETTVILLSDHGFHCDHLRPQTFSAAETVEAQAAIWHRHYGVLAMKGPDLLKDERIYGATLLDIAPTILSMYDLPVGQDMDGRPLVQAFQSPTPEVKSIPSWDDCDGDSGMHSPTASEASSESYEAIEQLVALGYLPQEALDAQKSVALAQAESKFNLAMVVSTRGQHQQALELLRSLYEQSPENPRYGLALAKTLANLNQHEHCLAIIDEIETAGHRNAESEILAAAELFNCGQADQANARLESFREKYPPSSYFYLIQGNIFLQQSQWTAALETFRKAVGLDHDNTQAHYSLSIAANRIGQYELAADHALEAIGTLYFFPQAHYQLGLAFKGMKDIPRAIRSLDIAVSQSPQLLDAHQELAWLYDQTNNTGMWLKHQRLAKGLPPMH